MKTVLLKQNACYTRFLFMANQSEQNAVSFSTAASKLLYSLPKNYSIRIAGKMHCNAEKN